HLTEVIVAVNANREPRVPADRVYNLVNETRIAVRAAHERLGLRSALLRQRARAELTIEQRESVANPPSRTVRPLLDDLRARRLGREILSPRLRERVVERAGHDAQSL